MPCGYFQGSKNKQRIDPFKMLMDESPNPSPPRPRPHSEVLDTPPASSPPPSGAVENLKQSDKRRSTSMRSSDKVPEICVSKTHKPARSKSLSGKHSTQSTSKILSSPTSKAAAGGDSGGGGGGGGVLKKKGTTVSSGQLLRPSTGVRHSSHDEQKRKLFSAKH